MTGLRCCLTVNELREGACGGRLRTAGEVLFYLGFGTWLSWRVFSTTMFALPDGSPLNTLVHFASLALVALSVTTWLREWRQALVGVAALAVGVACWACSGDSVLLDAVVIVFAAVPWGPRRAVALALVVTSVIVVVTVVSSQLGVIDDYLWLRADGEQVRHGLGFLYCTFPAHYLFFMTTAYSYLRRGDLRLAECVVIVLLDVYFYALTDSRNPFALTLLFLAAVMCLRVGRLRRLLSEGRWRYALCGVFALFAALSLVATVAYDPSTPLWSRANDVLSGRLAQTSASLDRYGIQPFGREVELAGNGLLVREDGASRTEGEGVDVNFVDNAYMSSLIRCGVFPTLLTLSMMTSVCWGAARRRDPVLLAACAFTAVHALVDPQMLELNYNLLLLAAAWPLRLMAGRNPDRQASKE